jgi:ADP-ribose pyrophosphatase
VSGAAERRLRSIEIVEDRTARSRCDEGFLRLRRLRLRNRYEDGSHSEVYPCDVLSRPGSDAVVAVLYEIDGERRVRVLLRDAPRAPVYLRREKHFVHPDPRVYLSLLELVAGMVEEADGAGDAGLCRRAAVEAREEAGLPARAEDFRVLGGESFASPGTGDEKLRFCAGRAQLAQARPGAGDGSVMEEGARVVTLELADAIEACRSGTIPDMKTEIGLLRLADHLGYLPQLRCFADELPPALARRYTRLGVLPEQ